MSALHPAARRDAHTDWFDHGRLGLFVHFGLYSVPARHEWVMSIEKQCLDDYERYAQYFDPDLFDANEIARRAQEAGMTYAVMTAKHHDGFCLFDTAHTPYNSVNHQGRDLIAEWCQALRRHGLKVGIYYSLLDWHHPDFTIDYHHPQRDDKDANAANEGKDFARYRGYLHAQVRELLTNYGAIDYIFFDFSYPRTQDGWAGKDHTHWGSRELTAMCRELQPHIIINDRLDIPGDLVTPEQYQPTEPMSVAGTPVRWEACQTLNGSWGYDRDNHNVKPIRMILRMLADTVAKNGNLLLNIGPNGRGALTSHDSHVLHEVGEWMRLHRQAIVGAGDSSFTPPPHTVYTQRGDRLYIHVFDWPFAQLHLPGLAGKVRFARLLNDGSEIPMRVHEASKEALTTQQGGQPEGTLSLQLPIHAPDTPLPVIELFLESTHI